MTSGVPIEEFSCEKSQGLLISSNLLHLQHCMADQSQHMKARVLHFFYLTNVASDFVYKRSDMRREGEYVELALFLQMNRIVIKRLCAEESDSIVSR